MRRHGQGAGRPASLLWFLLRTGAAELGAAAGAGREAAPDATEKISYRMPTFFLNGNLVHFAAYKQHIGFYPAPSGTERFADELKEYATSKGAIRFPLDGPLPLDLVSRIVRFRADENRKKKTAR